MFLKLCSITSSYVAKTEDADVVSLNLVVLEHSGTNTKFALVDGSLGP